MLYCIASGADGGGYSYRLCKAGGALEEACFQQHALRFDGSTSLRWGGPNGFSENVTNNFVTDSAPKAGLVGNLYSGITVVPRGSIWAQNPVSLHACLRAFCARLYRRYPSAGFLVAQQQNSPEKNRRKILLQIPDPQYSADPGTFSPRCRQSKGRHCACNVYDGGCKLEIVDQVKTRQDLT